MGVVVTEDKADGEVGADGGVAVGAVGHRAIRKQKTSARICLTEAA